MRQALLLLFVVAIAGTLAVLAVSPPASGWSPEERRSVLQVDQGLRPFLNPEGFVAAARNGDENAVRRALAIDTSLARETDTLGMTALDWAATREHWHIFEQLIAAGAPVDRVGDDGGTVMHRVCHHDRPDMLQLVLNAGGDFSARNQWGRTPLHVTARRGAPGAAKLLLAEGADPNVGTNEGWTPLHVAYLSGQPEMVELLLANGADPQARDNEGKLPADHAFERPATISMAAADLYDYQGLFDVSEDFYFKVWTRGGKLFLRDFSDDELYATGPDTFYCKYEPWAVTFSRDGSGEIDGIEVQFLRRAVTGSKRDHPLYLGSGACRECHLDEQHEGPYLEWVASRHAAAYWRLATEWALFLALERPHFQDMKNPLKDGRCLRCHLTGAHDPDALYAPSYEMEEGIGCETCHGPGSGYLDSHASSNRTTFLAAGGVDPDQGTCRTCHRIDEVFDFDELWPLIAH
jgi:hypothetical protein